VAFDFSRHVHALVTLYVQFLCSDWSKFDSWEVVVDNVASVLLTISSLSFSTGSNLHQGRNMVYGLRAQSPKYDWDQGSEERAQGSEEWNQGSQGF
ncbi:unnamed protein product, partial [Porites evermanni]